MIPRVRARILDAAGIDEPELREAYEACRRLHAAYGRTYYLASLLLPPAKRPYIWALYGFARRADELVDATAEPDPQELAGLADLFWRAMAGEPTTDPVIRAMVHTMQRWRIPRSHVEAFFESMQQDLTVARYPRYVDLEKYMYGSAAVIGLQMLPVLEPVGPQAAPRARALGQAFQMTNFIRDVGEDLRDRGRIYLPQEDLDVFGVQEADLAAGVVTRPIRHLLEFEIERTRALYTFAEPGIEMLHPTSRDCIRTAFTLYGGILDEIERNGYQVLTRRIAVPLGHRLAVALPALRHARAVRRDQSRWVDTGTAG